MRFDQIKHQPSQPDQRERPDTAGDCWFVALVGFLEGEAEKKGQCEQQRQPLGEFDGRHGPVYHADPSARADLFEIREMDSLAEGMGFEFSVLGRERIGPAGGIATPRAGSGPIWCRRGTGGSCVPDTTPETHDRCRKCPVSAGLQ
jgi:hypothetical protein